MLGQEEVKVEEEKKAVIPLVLPKAGPISFRNCKSLLLTEDGLKLIFQGLREKSVTLELLMRGSEHGFTKEKFWDRVCGIAPTLSVFKSHLGKVFGGYTD